MKKSRLAVLALAVAAAGGAYLVANTQKPPAQPEIAAPAPAPVTDEVLVAAHDLVLGAVVADADMTWQPWPKTGVAAGMLLKSDPKILDDLRGSIVRADIFQGEPIRREKLIKSGAGFMSFMLPSGKRAVAITIDSQGATTAGGFIHPGDQVDVIRTFHDDAKGANANTFVSETLLHNIKVLAIGPNLQEKNGQPVVVGSNATLELDPVQAETIVLAQRVGQLSLTLRSIMDANKEADPTQASTEKDLTVVRFGYAGDGAIR